MEPLDIAPITLLLNNRPIDDFDGLTPHEMDALLYATFDAKSVLQIRKLIADEVLDQIPFFRLCEDLTTSREENLQGCYIWRTFRRFFKWFGFIEFEKEKTFHMNDTSLVCKSPLTDRILSMDSFIAIESPVKK